MTGRAVLGAKSSELRGEPQPGAPVLVVRCDVLCGAVTVRRPDWLMRRRARRESAASGSGSGNVCPADDPA
jgi:hypothetical protein